MAAGHDPVEVSAEAEEGDIAEIEQAGEADDDVEPERQQGVDEREQPVAVEVALVRDEREDRERAEQDDQASGCRQSLPGSGDGAAETFLGCTPLVEPR